MFDLGDEKLLRALKLAAEIEERPVANLVRILLWKAVRKDSSQAA